MNITTYIINGEEYPESHPVVVEFKKQMAQKETEKRIKILAFNAFDNSKVNLDEYGTYGVFSAPTNEGYHNSAPINLLAVYEGKPKDIKAYLIKHKDFIYLFGSSDGYYVGEVRKLDVIKVS